MDPLNMSAQIPNALSPIDMTSQPDQLKNIAMLGMQGLQSGKIKPAEAKSHLDDIISMSAKPQPKQPSKQTSTRTTNKGGDEALQDNLDTLRNTPEMSGARKGIQDSEDQLNMMKNMPYNGGSEAWVKPLAALADSETGSSISKGLTPQQTPQERNAMILKYQDDIAKRKEELAKTLLSSGSKNAFGTTTVIGDPSMMGGGAGGAKMINAIAGSGGAFEKGLEPVMKVIGNLERAHNILTSKDQVLTAKNFSVASQDAINAVAQGNSTEGKVGREMPEQLTLEINNIKNKYGGKQIDIRTTPEGRDLVKNYLAFVDSVKGDYQDYGARKTGLIKQNYDFIDNPQVRATVDQKHKSYQDIFKRAAAAEAAPAGGKDLSKMSQAELDAYEKSLHGGQ